ncbi:hydroxysqualene dehydroxylase HpnE [Roseateles sp.]|uniref:hydroxysqualene dehydroxylase HpnE n=1 Tax=Roseateles sp. TaxID=1971397 RepID=UPI003D1508D3
MPAQPAGLRVAVVGGGWAGLAAAVRACDAGHRVQLFDMAGQLGGRARSLPPDEAGLRLDNGQHILIGAYRRSLALMRQLGVAPETALLRLPLRLRYPQHEGLRLPPGAAMPAFVRGVLTCQRWSWPARLGLLSAATGWLLHGFRCAPELSVAQLCRGLPQQIKDELIDPLCVAALNTPAAQASASVFLRVLHDALFSGPGSSDLLLPRRPLSELLAEPAQTWLQAHGAELRLGHRVQSLAPRAEGGWLLEGEAFDRIILACSAAEAARLTAPLAPGWSAQAAALNYEPIITVYLQHPGPAWPAPMLALQEGPQAPAQFAFDLGQLCAEAAGRSAWVISGAAPWVERGLEAAAEAVRRQAQRELGWAQPPALIRVLAEKRATFACRPGLQRPPAAIATGLWAAGDYVAGPYPATLEGAVLAGEFAAANL